MPTYIRGYTERAETPADPGTPIRFVASTEGVARDGLIINADGWDLRNFKANPTFLWSHDYTGQRPPIGKVTDIRVDGGKLIADVMFDQSDPFAVEVERKYRDGFLNAVSVGWDTKQIEPPKNMDGAARVTRAELLDLSAVNIPGDPNALMERQRIALRSYAQDILAEVADPTSDPELDTTARASWAETSAAMARLFWPNVQGPEAEREKAYKRLVRDYERHGKTPPEWIDTDTLNALDAEHVRGLFLEGETDDHAATFAAMDARAGAVLSQRNLDDLTRASELADQIRELVAGVVERGKKKPGDTEPDPMYDKQRDDGTLERLFRALNMENNNE